MGVSMGTPVDQVRNRAELPWGARGVLQGQEVMLPWVTPPQSISFSHLLHPLELRAYGNWKLCPILLKPCGNNSYLSL